MPTLLFSLRQVPDDEAEEIRALLDEHNIDFYETSAGNWGVSMPAIWLANDDNLTLAQQLLTQYQQQRFITQRQEYLLKQQSGDTPTFLASLRQQPLRFITYTLGALFIVYLSSRLIYELGF
ncbi:MAG: DUF6164 family protein [Methylococcales bacterium]|nr:DUF6164 family protein [Methylococcales bacterium]